MILKELKRIIDDVHRTKDKNIYLLPDELERCFETGIYHLISTAPFMYIRDYQTYSQLYYALNCEEGNDYHNLSLELNRYPLLYSEITVRNSPKYENVFLNSLGFHIHRIYDRKHLKNPEKRETDLRVEYANDFDTEAILDMFLYNFDIMSDRIPSKDELTELIRSLSVIKVQMNGGIAGFLIFFDKGIQSYLRVICVGERYRGYGVGKALITHYFNIHIDKDISDFYLWVDQSRMIAKRWYERLGYLDDGTRNYCYIKD